MLNERRAAVLSVSMVQLFSGFPDSIKIRNLFSIISWPLAHWWDVCLDQSEASIQVTWPQLTNKTPVWLDQRSKIDTEEMEGKILLSYKIHFYFPNVTFYNQVLKRYPSNGHFSLQICNKYFLLSYIFLKIHFCFHHNLFVFYLFPTNIVDLFFQGIFQLEWRLWLISNSGSPGEKHFWKLSE